MFNNRGNYTAAIVVTYSYTKRTEMIKLIYRVKKWMLKTAHVYIKIKLIQAIGIRQLFRKKDAWNTELYSLLKLTKFPKSF